MPLFCLIKWTNGTVHFFIPFKLVQLNSDLVLLFNFIFFPDKGSFIIYLIVKELSLVKSNLSG